MSNIRIKTTPNGSDNYVNVKLDQKFDFVEILSLKISQEEVYRKFCSDYGVIAGRVTINNGFGVPNAKVSIFIPVDEIDKENSEIFGLYPYEQVSDKNSDALRYNLLPKKNETSNDCFTPVGSFFNKREVQDNDEALYVYCKYYKFTTTTNSAGDFMIFGVPVGTHQLHVDADLSNIGIISQAPYDLIREGSNEKLFQSVSKFKDSKNLETLAQLKTKTPISVNVRPFWGDLDQCEIGITRNDVDLATNVIPTAIFMGSLFTDDDKASINKNCNVRAKMGKFKNIITGPGSVEMIRKTQEDTIERFDVEGGQVIDENGAWAYQVPMNLDYITTDEYGNIVPTDDPNRGIPTRARVRFRIGMLENGSEGRLRSRAKYLVPHNPSTLAQVDYSFSEKTKDASFFNMYWNKIYTVSSHIASFGMSDAGPNQFIGIKDIEDSQNSPFPFNKVELNKNGVTGFAYSLFQILCLIFTIFIVIVVFLNLLITVVNGIISAINGLIPGEGPIDYIRYTTLECGGQNFCVGCCQSCPGFESTLDPKIQDAVGSKWLDCQSAQLAIGLNMVKLNFYNDWVNGTLYNFLFKVKTKKRGKGRIKFCDWECSDNTDPVDNDENGTPDNKCKGPSGIHDTCVGFSGAFSLTPNYGGIFPIGVGLIKRSNEDGEYYYAPISKFGGIRLFPTKIMNLGSIFDCDWQGVPKFYPYLLDTTYNAPSESKVYYESNDPDYPGQLQENGYDDLLANIICGVGVIVSERQCQNAKRLCEIGMGIDEDRRDPATGTGAPVDGKMLNNDIENPWIRGVFTYLNYQTTLPNIPLVYIDDSPVVFNYNNQYYKVFRGYDSFLNPLVPQFKNSYYFYFGIKPGSSAIQKLYTKFLAPCNRVVENEIKIIVDDIVNDNVNGLGSGSIKFHIEGGIPPYTYQWIGPTYNNQQYTCPDPANSLTQNNCGDPSGGTFTLPNLLGGQYTLIVVDSNGEQVSTTINVDGLNNVQCEIQPTPVNSTGNGKVKIFINGGSPPYTIEIQGVTNTAYNNLLNTSLQTYCYGQCTGTSDFPAVINQLPAGEYLITVKDSGVPATINGQQTIITTECVKQLLITQPQNINLSVSVIDAICYNQYGQGLINVNGGVSPYSFEWVLVSTNNPNYQNLVNTTISTNIEPTNLPSGNYNITVLDFAGNIQTTTAVINEPPQITLNVLQTYSPGCYFSQTAGAQIQVNGQNPPYTVDVVGETNLSITNQGNGTIVLDNLFASNNPHTVKVTDNNGCEATTQLQVPYPQYGELYVRAITKTYTLFNISRSRITIRFKGGNGGSYHFKLPNGNWINIGNPYGTNLSISDYQTLNPDYTLYQSTTSVDGDDTFEFQFWVQDAGTPIVYPFNFNYYLTELGQQDVYAMFMGKMQLASDGTDINTQDSSFGTTAPYGCYTYSNLGNTPVIGQSPQGSLISTP